MHPQQPVGGAARDEEDRLFRRDKFDFGTLCEVPGGSEWESPAELRGPQAPRKKLEGAIPPIHRLTPEDDPEDE